MYSLCSLLLHCSVWWESMYSCRLANTSVNIRDMQLPELSACVCRTLDCRLLIFSFGCWLKLLRVTQWHLLSPWYLTLPPPSSHSLLCLSVFLWDCICKPCPATLSIWVTEGWKTLSLRAHCFFFLLFACLFFASVNDLFSVVLVLPAALLSSQSIGTR